MNWKHAAVSWKRDRTVMVSNQSAENQALRIKFPRSQPWSPGRNGAAISCGFKLWTPFIQKCLLVNQVLNWKIVLFKKHANVVIILNSAEDCNRMRASEAVFGSWHKLIRLRQGDTAQECWLASRSKLKPCGVFYISLSLHSSQH